MNIQKLDFINLTITSLSVFSLFFSITNYIPLSASLFLLIPFVVPLFFRYPTLHFVVPPLINLFLYFLLSTVIYYPHSLIEFDFYRRDGNFFVAYSPLLILSMLKVVVKLERIVMIFTIYATLANFLLILYFMLSGSNLYNEEPLYHFLFVAHNAAGGFLSTLCAFCIGFAIFFKEDSNRVLFRIFSMLASVNICGLILSDSRGSIVGILFASILYFCRRKKNIFQFTTSIIFISQVLLAIISYANSAPSYLTSTTEGFDVDSYDNIFQSGRSSTITIRLFYLIPRAVYLFLKSPFLGTGFGSYNDTPYNLFGIDNFFMVNIPNEYVFSESNAHHSFFNIMAETGIAGVILTLILIKNILKSIDSISLVPVRISLFISFWCAIIASFTEHRLFTPSQILPITIILGLAIANQRYISYESRISNLKQPT